MWWWFYTWHTATKATYVICYFRNYVNVSTKETAHFFYFACLQLISKGIDWKSLLLEISVCRNSSLAGTMFKMCGINSRFSFDPVEHLKRSHPTFRADRAQSSQTSSLWKRRTNAVCAFESARVALTLLRAGKAALSARDATPSFTH